MESEGSSPLTVASRVSMLLLFSIYFQLGLFCISKSLPTLFDLHRFLIGFNQFENALPITAPPVSLALLLYPFGILLFLYFILFYCIECLKYTVMNAEFDFSFEREYWFLLYIQYGFCLVTDLNCV